MCVLDQQQRAYFCVFAYVSVPTCEGVCVCKLIDGFYVFRAVNIRICQVCDRERETRINEKTQSRLSVLAGWGIVRERERERSNVWLVDDAHNRYEVIY